MSKPRACRVHGGLAVCLFTAWLGGCSYNAQDVVKFLQTPRSPISGTEYRVLPPDMLHITSQHVPEIKDTTERVRPDGKINLPLLGEIDVVRRTPKEIEEEIKKAAGKYYSEVDATVQVVGYNSQSFYTFGEVNRPGPTPWTGHDTLLDALARAQPTTLAWPERIIVVRPLTPQEGGFEFPQTPHYKKKGVRPESMETPFKKMTINMMAMVESGDMGNNILLMPNDVIYVQPNPMAKIGLAVQNMLFPLRPAAETVGMPGYAASSLGMMGL